MNDGGEPEVEAICEAHELLCTSFVEVISRAEVQIIIAMSSRTHCIYNNVAKMEIRIFFLSWKANIYWAFQYVVNKRGDQSKVIKLNGNSTSKCIYSHWVIVSWTISICEEFRKGLFSLHSAFLCFLLLRFIFYDYYFASSPSSYVIVGILQRLSVATDHNI